MSAPEQIARFAHWHYGFVLEGQHTRPERGDWQEIRAAQCVEPAVDALGGTLAGKRVLDLGCNAGFFALKAIEAGADFVLGIEGRQMHIDQAELVFDAYDVDPERYRFVFSSWPRTSATARPACCRRSRRRTRR